MEAERKPDVEWPHWPDRGNGHARRDRLEQGLFRDSEREAQLRQAETAVRRLEEVTNAKVAEVERLQEALVAADGSAQSAFLAFVWTPGGYLLREHRGAVPDVGGPVLVDGAEHVVAKLAHSPLPSDDRLCAYLEPVVDTQQP